VDIRNIVLSVEALGQLADEDDVKVILREVWVELKTVEQEIISWENVVNV